MSRPKKSKSLVSITILIEDEDVKLIDALKGSMGRGAFIGEAIKNPNIAQVMMLKLSNAELKTKLAEYESANSSQAQLKSQRLYDGMFNTFKQNYYNFDNLPPTFFTLYVEKLGISIEEIKAWLLKEKEIRSSNIPTPRIRNKDVTGDSI